MVDTDPTLECGESLIELLLAIAILGIVFVAVLGGMATSARGSTIYRDQTNVQALLIGSAASLADNTRNPYQYCSAGAVSYNPMQGVSPVSGATATVSSVQYWGGSSFQGTCFDDSVHKQYLQLVNLSVSSTDGLVKMTMSITKRP